MSMSTSTHTPLDLQEVSEQLATLAGLDPAPEVGVFPADTRHDPDGEELLEPGCYDDEYGTCVVVLPSATQAEQPALLARQIADLAAPDQSRFWPRALGAVLAVAAAALFLDLAPYALATALVGTAAGLGALVSGALLDRAQELRLDRAGAELLTAAGYPGTAWMHQTVTQPHLVRSGRWGLDSYPTVRQRIRALEH